MARCHQSNLITELRLHHPMHSCLPPKPASCAFSCDNRRPAFFVEKRLNPLILCIPAGNLWVNVGDERVDVGVNVKNGGKGLYVPDYVQPEPPQQGRDSKGWQYSTAMVGVLDQLKKRFPWLIRCDQGTLSFAHGSQTLLKGARVTWHLV